MYIMIVYSLAIHYAAPLSTGPLTAAVRARTSRTRYLFKRSCANDSCNTPKAIGLTNNQGFLGCGDDSLETGA